MTQQNGYEIFQTAQKNLTKNPNSPMDNFIVDLWNASKNLVAKNALLQQRAEKSESESRLATSRLDVANTRIAKLTQDNGCTRPTGFDASSWFESQLAIVTAESTAE